VKPLAAKRGETLARARQLIHDVVPDIEEERKWPGTPAWSHDGIVCTGESYKEVVKLTFARGATIKDPKKLFSSSLEGNARRAIDRREGKSSTNPPSGCSSAPPWRPIPRRVLNGQPRRGKLGPHSRNRNS
jgi:hypothetical protein